MQRINSSYIGATESKSAIVNTKRFSSATYAVRLIFEFNIFDNVLTNPSVISLS